MEILGNCDSQLFLGASDDMTAKQVSDHMGISTVETHSENRKAGIQGLTDFGSKNTSSSKRNLLNPDELLKLDKRKAVLMQRGYQPLMLYKMDYSEHEMAGALKSMGVRNYKLP
nr:TraM recognition domain-containing protein [Clostridium ljungdahlii]